VNLGTDQRDGLKVKIIVTLDFIAEKRCVFFEYSRASIGLAAIINTAVLFGEVTREFIAGPNEVSAENGGFPYVSAFRHLL
jgi:hypothetical protein